MVFFLRFVILILVLLRFDFLFFPEKLPTIL